MPAAPRLMEVLGLRRFFRGRAADTWASTTGTVLSASVQVGTSGTRRTELPLVYYAYQVDGQLFQGHRLRFTGAPWGAGAVVDECQAGSSVTVHYDPRNPTDSVIQLGERRQRATH